MTELENPSHFGEFLPATEVLIAAFSALTSAEAHALITDAPFISGEPVIDAWKLFGPDTLSRDASDIASYEAARDIDGLLMAAAASPLAPQKVQAFRSHPTEDLSLQVSLLVNDVAGFQFALLVLEDTEGGNPGALFVCSDLETQETLCAISTRRSSPEDVIPSESLVALLDLRDSAAESI